MSIFTALTSLIASAPDFMLAHAPLIGGLGMAICLAAALVWAKIRAGQEVDREGFVTISTEEHVLWAGYDGEGVYAWSCTCGEAESDFTGLDHATIAGTEHLLDVGAVPA